MFTQNCFPTLINNSSKQACSSATEALNIRRSMYLQKCSFMDDYLGNGIDLQIKCRKKTYLPNRNERSWF